MLEINIPAIMTNANNPIVTSTAAATCVITDIILEVIINTSRCLFTA